MLVKPQGSSSLAGLGFWKFNKPLRWLWCRWSLAYRTSHLGIKTLIFHHLLEFSAICLQVTIFGPISRLALVWTLVCSSLPHHFFSHLPLSFLFSLLEYSYLTNLINLPSIQCQLKCHFLCKDEWWFSQPHLFYIARITLKSHFISLTFLMSVLLGSVLCILT